MNEDVSGINKEALKRKIDKIDFYARDINLKLSNINTLMAALVNHYKGMNANKLYSRYKLVSDNYSLAYEKLVEYKMFLEKVFINYKRADTNSVDSIHATF